LPNLLSIQHQSIKRFFLFLKLKNSDLFIMGVSAGRSDITIKCMSQMTAVLRSRIIFMRIRLWLRVKNFDVAPDPALPAPAPTLPYCRARQNF
jgi:hypothetical protein